MIKNKIFLGSLAAVLLAGCSTNVQYEDVNSQDTTSVDYNLTDLRATTEKMVTDMLDSPAINRITAMDRPTLFFNNVRNETREHLNTSTLANTVQTQLIKSDKFQFVDMNQIKAIQEQAGYQTNSGMVDQNTAITLGKQAGARYMLYGVFQDFDSTNGAALGKEVRSKAYVITLKMMDLQTGVIVWQEDKQIRKSQTKSLFGM